MKELKIILEDDEHNKLIKKKKDLTWKQYILKELDKNDAKTKRAN